jgi:hypothetical protein
MTRGVRWGSRSSGKTPPRSWPSCSGVDPDECLQLGGDGLIMALAARADGAQDSARGWIARLRERDWFGDDELADQLAAGLGEGAVSTTHI